jgi:hypothetical protein
LETTSVDLVVDVDVPAQYCISLFIKAENENAAGCSYRFLANRYWYYDALLPMTGSKRLFDQPASAIRIIILVERELEQSSSNLFINQVFRALTRLVIKVQIGGIFA